MTDTDGTTFLSGANAEFIAELYARFLDDPAAVDESWRRFFAEIGDDAGGAACRARRAALGACAAPAIGERRRRRAPARGLDAEAFSRAATNSIRALQLIRAYRVRGHLEADLDPLGLEQRAPIIPSSTTAPTAFTEADLDREIFINNLLGRERATLREIIASAARDLLRPHRRRIHAHPGTRRAAMDPAEIRAPRRRPTLTSAGKKECCGS